MAVCSQLDSCRVGTLLVGEVVMAQPAVGGGLRLHCFGLGWASAASDDGSPLLLPLSHELRSNMPVFGRYYSATVRVGIRDTPGVSSASIGADAAILPGECVRIDRVVLNEMAVPKIAIIHETEYEADASAGAEAVSSTATWGWASFWSISDASALFVMEDETPPPSRVWGVGGTKGPGTGLRPPSCRPPPAPQLDGSGGPTSVDTEGRIIFGYHEPRTVTRAALALQAQGKSATAEKMKLKKAINASAEMLYDRGDQVTRNGDDSMKLDATASELVPTPGNQWRERSFLANLDRHTKSVDESEQPRTVSSLRGHASMDDLSYIRQTFAQPSNPLVGSHDTNRSVDSDGVNCSNMGAALGNGSVVVVTNTSKAGGDASRSTERSEGGPNQNEDMRTGRSGYSMVNSTLHSPSSWLHVDNGSTEKHNENWTRLGLDQSNTSSKSTAVSAGSTQEWEREDEQQRLRARARLAKTAPRPPPPKVPNHPLPPRPTLSSAGAWSLSDTWFGPDVEAFLEPLGETLPGLRKSCQIARMDDEKLAELEALRRHWCLEEGDNDVHDAVSHPFLHWMQRLGVGGIDHTLAVCAALRHVYQERWDTQAAETTLLAKETEDRQKNVVRA